MSTSNRGKWAEGEVRKVLKSMEKADFAFAKWPDAYAGSFAVAPADFMILHQGRMILLEVKEVQHGYLLPYKNMPPDQIARIRAWVFAGATGYGLVYFKETQEWFMAGIDWFFSNRVSEREGRKVGSWDTRGCPKFSKKQLKELLGNYV